MTEDISKAMGDSMCAKMSSITAGVIVAAGFGIVTVYLGMYTFNNPDADECWVIRDLDVTARSRTEVIDLANSLDVDIIDGYPIEMHRIFKVWFVWGFYGHAAALVLGAISAIVGIFAANIGMIIATITGALYFLNACAWVAVGFVWRFSKAGVIAAGDLLEREAGTTDEIWDAQLESAKVRSGYQLSSGRFLKIYLLVGVWLIGLILVGAIIILLTVACCTPNKQESYDQFEADKEGTAACDRGDGKQSLQKK